MTSQTDIRASELVVQEVEDGEVAVTVRRADVVRLVLERGSAAERPIVQLAFGVLSGALASWLLWRVSLFLWAGRASGGGWGALAGGGLIALIIAVALVRRALSRRYFVRATLANGTSRKLLLPPEWSDAERGSRRTCRRWAGPSGRVSWSDRSALRIRPENDRSRDSPQEARDLA